MNPRNVEFLIGEALVGVRRNGLMAVASISTIALSLAILADFCLLILAVHNMAQRELRRFEIAVFLDRHAPRSVAVEIADRVREIPSVRSVRIYPREEAWTEFKKTHANISVAGLNNPLPDKLRVAVRDPKDSPEVAEIIRGLPKVHKVEEGRTHLRHVLAAAELIKGFGIAASLALLIATIFIISNAIRLTVYVRRREIKIMQMVGATNWFIRVPLVLEGVIFGASGAAIAFVLVGAGISYLSTVAARTMPMMQSVSSGIDRGQVVAALLIGGVLIGAAGSSISIRRFLRI